MPWKCIGHIGGTTPIILNLGTGLQWVVNIMLKALNECGKRSSVHKPLNRRLDVPQGQSGCFGEQVNLLSLPGFEPLTGQPVAWTILVPPWATVVITGKEDRSSAAPVICLHTSCYVVAARFLPPHESAGIRVPLIRDLLVIHGSVCHVWWVNDGRCVEVVYDC
jgi:hypothetical protein